VTRGVRVSMLLMLALLLGACIPDRHEPAVPPPEIAIFFTADATRLQKKTVADRVRGMPDVQQVAYESREEAYARFQELWKDDPNIPDVEPDTLPDSLRVTVTGADAYDRMRDSQEELLTLPGVADVVFPCASMAECRERLKQTPR
jgi:cell division protein FtsX